MNCLYCGKPLNHEIPEEFQQRWHTKCIRSFFGTDTLPVLDISNRTLEDLAMHAVNGGAAVPGVQKKLSLHLSKESVPKLTIVNHPNDYILKPSESRYPYITELEHLTMSMAQAVGIQTVKHGLIPLNNGLACITRREDRELDEKDSFRLRAMEDFAQLSNRISADKYKGSYEQAAKVIEKFSHFPVLDKSRFFQLLVFCFITGNSDMHLKNFSLIENRPGSRLYSLAPAYDLLPVNLVLPEDTEMTALTLHGKKKNQRKNDFLYLADNMGLPRPTALRIIQNLCRQEHRFFSLIDQSELPETWQQKFKHLIHDRINRLS
ncbi:HipA domain-containing protein [Faecalibaculum rodentium]|nr:HipA domain-containing protein [Faecalibaculum rodentium]